MSWLGTIQYRCVSVCVLFFDDRTCHVSSTERRAHDHIQSLTRVFKRLGFETLASKIVSVSHANRWDRVRDKYMWRYLMAFAGFQIVNQDGTYFENVEAETWDDVKMEALSLYSYLSLRPALQLVSAESKTRKRKFFPRQAVQRLLRDSHDKLLYNDLERAVLGLTTVPVESFRWVVFRNGRLSLSSGIFYNTAVATPPNEGI